jgi:hypothetical protein
MSAASTNKAPRAPLFSSRPETRATWRLWSIWWLKTLPATIPRCLRVPISLERRVVARYHRPLVTRTSGNGLYDPLPSGHSGRSWSGGFAADAESVKTFGFDLIGALNEIVEVVGELDVAAAQPVSPPSGEEQAAFRG